MITTLAMGLVLLGPSTPEGQWGPATLSAAALAQQVDARMASLSMTKLQYRYVYDKSAVGHAEALCDGTIVGPQRFWIQLPNMDLRRNRAPLMYETWVADGKKFGRAVNPNSPTPGPMSARPRVPARPLEVWFTDFSRVILAGVGNPTKPFTQVVADAQRRGYKTAVQTRWMNFRGHRLTSHRIVMTKGLARYEVVFDGRGKMPVSVTNSIGQDKTRWTDVDWDFRPGKRLNPRDARFTKSGEVRDIGPVPRRY